MSKGRWKAGESAKVTTKAPYLMTFAKYWKTKEGSSAKDPFGREYRIGRYSGDKDQYFNVHRAYVQLALIQGKKVPKSVLKEHPTVAEEAAKYLRIVHALENMRPGTLITYHWVGMDEQVEFRKLYPDGTFLAKLSSGKNKRLAVSRVSLLKDSS